MVLYVAFYDNKGGSNVVPVAFKSEKKLDDFIRDYENFGGIRQFNYDIIGSDKKSFVRYLENHGASGKDLLIKKQVVNYDGKVLFKYMMRVFGVRLK